MTAVVAGLLLVLSTIAPRPRGDGVVPWLTWFLAGLGLIAIGLDERFQLHEWARVMLVRPAGIAADVDWLNPGDIVTLIYPLGALVAWGILFRSLAGDRVSRALLVAVPLIGLVAVGIDVLDIDVFDRYPGWVYSGVIEEVSEWEVVALMSVVAWRHLTTRLLATLRG